MNDFTNDTEIFEENTRTLLIDGDLLIYQKCCVHNEDDDIDRRLITNYLRTKISEACSASNCGRYRVFLTAKENFRHWISDRYKINRVGVEKPVNLAFAKQWSVDHMNAEYELYLEADDLMAIHQTEDTVIYSGDKDLRQVPGAHLNANTFQMEHVSELGAVWTEEAAGAKPDKIKFNGYKGFMFQCLTGDSTDSILGCGVRKRLTYKSGPQKGDMYLKRLGIGPKAAMQLLKGCPQTKQSFFHVVKREFQKLYSEGSAMREFEKEANLLYMVRDYDPETKLAKRWTYDEREEHLNITTGEIL